MDKLTPEKISRQAQTLAVFPAIAKELLRRLDDEDGNLHLLADHSKHDPVIAARLLALANAASFSDRNKEPVKDLYTAISLIGLERFRKLVLSLSIASGLKSLAPADAFAAYWSHSLEVAVAAQVLAEHCRQPGDLAWLCGLLHDLGKLWLLHQPPAAASHPASGGLAGGMQINPAALRRHSPGMEDEGVEKLLQGMDHAEIGFTLGKAWGLPELVCLAIRDHHGLSPTQEPISLIVQLAEAVIFALNACRHDPGPGFGIVRLSPFIQTVLKPDWEKMPFIYGEIEARIRTTRAEITALSTA